jgi:hypothetical protein
VAPLPATAPRPADGKPEGKGYDPDSRGQMDRLFKTNQ